MGAAAERVSQPSKRTDTGKGPPAPIVPGGPTAACAAPLPALAMTKLIVSRGRYYIGDLSMCGAS
jgi:hypothetical protein